MSDAPVLGPLQTLGDPATADDFHKKHTPVIALEVLGEGRTRVSVRVGALFSHPNQPDHFIQWISVYAGDAEILRFDLVPVASAPDVSGVIAVDPGTAVRAIGSCNLHGLWVSEVTA